MTGTFNAISISVASWLLFAIASARNTVAQDAHSACSLPGLQTEANRSYSDAELLAAYNAQSSQIHSIQAAAAVHGWAGSARLNRPSPVSFYFRDPALLRSTGEAPLSNRKTVDLLSDGRDFWLLVPDGKQMRLFTGPVDAPPVSKNAQANLRPRPLIDAFHWQAGTLNDAQEPAQSGEPKTRILDLALPAEPPFPPRTALVAFDLRAGVVDSIRILDSSRRVVLALAYADWRSAEGNHCYPMQITMVQPLDNRELDIRISTLLLNAWIPGQEFRMPSPIGTPVTHLAKPPDETH